MGGLKRSSPPIKQTFTAERVGQGVYSCKEKVESQAKVVQIREIREPSSCLLTLAMRTVPGKDEENGGEGIDGEQKSKDGEHQGRKDYRGRKPMIRVEWSCDA